VKILLDCDTGIDDAITLLYLASLIRTGEVDLAGVGTVHGNVAPRTGALNTLRLLDLAGVENVPVAIGAGRPALRRPSRSSGWPARSPVS
jgi:purine nucleosidase